MEFEILKYKKAGSTESLVSTWESLNLDLSKESEEIKEQIRLELKSKGLGVYSSEEIQLDLEVGIIEILNKKGKEIYQLRSNED